MPARREVLLTIRDDSPGHLIQVRYHEAHARAPLLAALLPVECEPTSRDLLLSAAQLDIDKLDFTVDEKWLTPLQHWLSHTFGSGAKG